MCYNLIKMYENPAHVINRIFVATDSSFVVLSNTFEELSSIFQNKGTMIK